MAPFEASALTLDAVLGDLSTIASAVMEEEDVGAASYETVQLRLGDLSLHALTYIRFLEDHGFVSYDRSADRIVMTDLGRSAATDSEVWKGPAAQAFVEGGYEEIDQTEQGSALGTLSGQVDEILDSISEIDVEAILDEVSSSETAEFKAEMAPRGPGADPAETTQPELDAPAKTQNEASTMGKGMSNDSFRLAGSAVRGRPLLQAEVLAPSSTSAKKRSVAGAWVPCTRVRSSS